MTDKRKRGIEWVSEADLWNTKCVIDRLLDPMSPGDATQSTTSLAATDHEQRSGYYSLLAPGCYMKGHGRSR